MSDRIFELVHSLNKSEKRYFKQHLKRHSSNFDNTIYARFFDYITRTKQYDRELLLRKCDFIKDSQFQNIRSRLYNLILESLRIFHSGKSVRVAIFQLLISAEVLVRKGLFTHAIQTLTKAEKLANHYEMDSLLEEILRQQEHLVTTRSKQPTHRNDIQRIQLQYKSIIQSRVRINDLRNIKAIGYNVFRIEGRVLRDIEDGEPFKKVLQEFEANHQIDPESFKEVYFYHLEWSNFKRLNGQFKESFNHLEKIESFYNGNPHYKEAYLKEYVRFLAIQVIVSNMLCTFKKSIQIIRKIEQLYTTSQSEAIHVLIFENILFH